MKTSPYHRSPSSLIALNRTLGVICLLLVLFVHPVAAQNQSPAQPSGQAPKKPSFPATVLVFCDLPCSWSLDGKSRGEIDSGNTGKAGVQLGSHQVVAQSLDGLDQVEKQVVIKEKGETTVQIELQSLRDSRVALEQQANAARPAEQAYEDAQMLNAQQEFDKARPLFEQACNDGHANACASLGYMYDAGKGGSQDYLKASAAYQKACDGGVVASCTSLGILYEYGHGVTQDYGKARTNYQKGCDGGYPSGCSYLGDLYLTGHGGPKDIEHGRQLLQKGCDLGDQWGCDELKKKP
ncbi:MAG TPA: tetratricopeptide repeat protein [Terracidiphilus sp.]|nr:tetratricopeptide repeat protein [Terracidiphilus sp.]